MFSSGHLYLRGGQSLNILSSSSVLNTVEAANKPSVGITPRELKPDRNYESSDLYSRAHHLIYGKKGPLGPDGRVRIAVVINGEEGIVVENRIKNQIYSQLRKKFPRESFAVMKGTDVNTYLLTLAEDDMYDARKGVSTIVPSGGYDNNGRDYSTAKGYGHVGNQQHDIDGMPVGNQPRGLSDMRLMDYVNAGRKYDYDYVFVMTMNLGERVRYGHSLLPLLPIRTHTNKQNVWVRARFVDVKDGSYVYRNDVVAMGKKHNGFFNGRVFEDGVRLAVEEILNDIMINED